MFDVGFDIGLIAMLVYIRGVHGRYTCKPFLLYACYPKDAMAKYKEGEFVY